MKRNLFFAFSSVFIGILALLGALFYMFFYPKLYVKDTDTGEYVHVTASEESPFPVSKKTIFQIEHYYPDEERTLIEEVRDFPALLGCDKAGVEAYLTDYMKHLSYEERAEGLSSYELTAYHDHTICLRKTYQKTEYTGFIAKSFNGTVVILKGDGKTVYEYTDIQIHNLPSELKEQVVEGYVLEDEEALYGFLENYSS